MRLSLDDTIAAIASAPGGAVRGIVRITGPDTCAVVERCFRGEFHSLANIVRAQMFAGHVKLPTIDVELAADLLFWPNHRSYTGQPSAELHTIGSPPLVQAMLDAVCAAGCRPAAPGEFTLRAVLNGRLDLTQAEAVLGVIDATEERDLRVAIDQLAGGLGGPLRQLRGELLDSLAHLEAGLDFVEEDIEFIEREALRRQLTEALEVVQTLQRRLSARGAVVDLPRVVLVGAPNAGKSSLFNALVDSDAAIVSAIAGTTRDYLSARVRLGAIECELVDTAGLDDSTELESIEGMAQQQTHQQHDRADVLLMCIEASKWDERYLEEWPTRESSTRILVLTKSDLAPPSSCSAFSFQLSAFPPISTSVTTRSGLDDLRRVIARAIDEQRHGDVPVVASTAARSASSLRSAAESLEQALVELNRGGGEELVAAEIRLALDALGEVVGAVFTDDILDRIFSRFCIGK